MTIEQNRIADQLLKFISSNNGMVNADQYHGELTRSGTSLKDIIFVREQLFALNIIQYVNGSDNYRIMLSPILGDKAVQLGLEKYIKSNTTNYINTSEKVKDFTKELLTLLNENGGLNTSVKINEFLKSFGLEENKIKIQLIAMVSEGFIHCPNGRNLGNSEAGRGKLTLDNLVIEAALKAKGLEFYTAQYKQTNNSEPKDDITTINERLNEVIEWLKRNELGSEIIFDEIQELKEAGKKLNLKNWKQLVKGKLFDLASKEVVGIGVEELRKMLKTLTGEDITKLLE